LGWKGISRAQRLQPQLSLSHKNRETWTAF